MLFLFLAQGHRTLSKEKEELRRGDLWDWGAGPWVSPLHLEDSLRSQSLIRSHTCHLTIYDSPTL